MNELNIFETVPDNNVTTSAAANATAGNILQSDAPTLHNNTESGDTSTVEYAEDDIKTLDWREHIRLRPGMYIGKLGDGSYNDDGIYVLLKEVLDNAIDEYMMGYGKHITVDVEDRTVRVRDYGRGIPLGKLIDVASKMNTGAKYDSKAFKKSVGLNGVGIKAVNALSTTFTIRSHRDGLMRAAIFERGVLIETTGDTPTDEPNGTYVEFTPDDTIFRDYSFNHEFIVTLLKNYTYLNTGLAIIFNGKRYLSRDGLLDLLKANMTKDPLYPVIHLKGDDIEVAITHANQYGEEYYSFVNGQHTTQGGTHLAAFKESVSRTIKDYFGRNFEYSDIRNGMIAAVSIKVEEPVFESQTKTKLGSRDMGKDGPTVAKHISDFLKKELDNYLHKNLDTSEVILKKIQESERERKAMSGIAKIARERAKKVNLHNSKLRDCRIHLNDTKGDNDRKLQSSIFITEGDSASGSITKIRDVETQAVFSLRGKPLNSFGLTRKVVYENEEFNLLQAALNIEDGIDGLRYNNVIIATDADVDGMHIRLLLLTFFLQFFPDLVKKGHVYVLQTPLFRVRDANAVKRSGRRKAARPRKDNGADGSDTQPELPSTVYCYTDEERIKAIERFGAAAEITRFKGLGEISPDEFRGFIGPDMRLDRVTLRKEDGVAELLEFYMGKNTSDRQTFIIDNLVVEDDSEIEHI
ncbi:MAG: type IIA DNA topoisomerase subunit B [Bacteroidales bacterium]|nr:type IIA DNA topoisomerase subunit B [Bacteroidales bacterium]